MARLAIALALLLLWVVSAFAQVTIDSPAGGSTSADWSLTAIGKAAPASQVELHATNASGGSTWGPLLVDNAGNWQTTVLLVDGTYTLTAIQTTGIGSPIWSAPVTISIDTTPPLAPIVAAPANGGTVVSLTPVITGLAEALSTITISIDGTVTGTAPADGSGNWSFPVSVPLSVGAHTVDATATDAVGNMSASSATNSFTVVGPPPVAGPVNLIILYASVNYPIPLALSGGAATSVFVTSPPANGTTSISGTTITYTPHSGYYGSDSFAYTATGPGGTSAPALVTITVQLPVLNLSPGAGALPDATVGQAYNQAFSTTGAVGPVTYSSSALPNGLVFDPAAGVLSGTPSAGTQGSHGFSVAATDGLSSRTGFYTLEILAGAGVTVANQSVVYRLNAPAVVDLTLGATGGPFSGATLDGTIGAGLVSLVADGGTFRLHFQPDVNQITPTTAAFTLASAFGSASATVTFTADPGAATAFVKLIEKTTRTFVDTRANLLSSGIGTPSLLARFGGGPGVIDITPNGDSVTLNFASSTAGLAAWNEAGNAAEALASGAVETRFNAWIDASATVHLRSDGTDESWGHFALLSVGADYRVTDALMVGLALHGDVMASEDETSEIDGKGYMIGPYLSAELVDGVILDAALYYGQSWNDITAGLFRGTFETERLIAKLGLAGDWAISDSLTLRPQVNAFYMRETADGYVVEDRLGSSLAVPGFDSEQLRLSSGGTLEYAMTVGDGLTLTPYIGGQFGVALSQDQETAFARLSLGFNLAGLGVVSLGGEVATDFDTAGFKALTAKGRLAAGF